MVATMSLDSLIDQVAGELTGVPSPAEGEVKLRNGGHQVTRADGNLTVDNGTVQAMFVSNTAGVSRARWVVWAPRDQRRVTVAAW